MARRGFGSISDDDDELNVDISPMIDCVFILLIFFIVTTVFIDESGFRINQPEASSVSASNDDSFSIKITAEDQLLINDKPANLGELDAAVKTRLTENNSAPISIQSSPDARVGTVQQAHDVARAAVIAVGGKVENISISKGN